MEVKEYKLYKTAKKTAAENHLIIANNPYLKNLRLLFDFSLLDEISSISGTEKDYIKREALKHVSPANREQFYGVFEENTGFNGEALYYKHRVYSDNGCKYLYDIIQLAKIHHISYEKDGFQNHIVSQCDTLCGYAEPISDIEI